MGCKDCKKKNTIKEELFKTKENTPKTIIWFVIIWSIFSIYGIYSSIIDLLTIIEKIFG